MNNLTPKLIFVLLLYFCTPALAQQTGQDSTASSLFKTDVLQGEVTIAKKSKGHFLMDLSALSITFSGIFSSHSDWQFGFGGGFGVELLNLIPVSGQQFSPDYGLTSRGEHSEDNDIYEYLFLHFFAHKKVNRWLQLNTGLRLATFVHFSNGEGSGGMAIGPFIHPSIGSGKLTIGSRLFAGILSDPGTREFSIVITPVILRIMF